MPRGSGSEQMAKETLTSPFHMEDGEAGNPPVARRSRSNTIGSPEAKRFQLLLLLSGVVRPTSKNSRGWWFCWLFWRAQLVVGIGFRCYFLTETVKRGAWSFLVFVEFCYFFSVLQCCLLYWTLPRTARRIRDAITGTGKEPLEPEYVQRAFRFSMFFIVPAVLFGLHVVVKIALGHPGINIIEDFMLVVAPIPILGTSILILAYEMSGISADIVGILQAARDHTLSREQYEAVRLSVQSRNDTWNGTITVLSAVALESCLGLLFTLAFPEKDPWAYVYNSVTYENFFHILSLGREVLILFILVVLAASINDAVDAVTATLNSSPWGDLRSSEREQIALELTRLDLLHLSISNCINDVRSDKPLCLKTICGADCSRWKRPLGFRVLLQRPTRRFLIASAVSFSVACMSALVQSYFGFDF